jgi:branched-chain amino acid transport system permease protein
MDLLAKRVWPIAKIIIPVTAIALLPLVADEFQLTIAVFIGINVIMVFGLSLLMGYAGQISLGHAGLYGLGAYTTAIMTTRFSISPFITIVLGAIIAGLVAYLIGLPALRLKGHYLAMATLGAGIIIQVLFVELQPITMGPGGITGIPPLTLGKINLSETSHYFYVIYLIVLAVLWVSLSIVKSQKGRALRALHENETAASSIGINVEKHKLFIFAFSGVLAGIAGALYAHYALYVSPDTFGLNLSILIVIMVVIGGTENLFAAVLGAVLITVISEYFREYQDYSLLFFGLSLVLIMIFAPRGLFVELAQLTKKLRNRYGIAKSRESY